MYLGVPHPNDSALVTGDDTTVINIVDIDEMGKKGKCVSTVDGAATPVTERRNISTVYCVNSLLCKTVYSVSV